MVERIRRALELARQQRGALSAPAHAHVPSSEVPALGTGAVTAAPARIINAREESLRQARLLLPGLGGKASHGFRLLRTQVMQRMRNRGWNTLAVLSAAPDEGKTFTAINLAITIGATTDSSALLVDLDLRFPRIYRRFDFLPTVGIEDCLRLQARVSDATVAVQGYPGLTLLPARGPVEHSSELIGSAGAQAVFRELKARAGNGIVIYDLPPLLATDDALTFVPHVDAVLLVVGDDRTRRDDLRYCTELLKDTPVVGIVLNGSRTERSAEYAY